MVWCQYSSSKTTNRPGRGALCAAIICTMLWLSADASAAELRGRIREHRADRAPAGAVLHAACGDTTRKTGLVGMGSYSIRGLPSGSPCELWLEIGEHQSHRIPFTTGGPVTRFSGQVRRRGSDVILMPE